MSGSQTGAASSAHLKNMSDKECKDLGNKMFSVRNLEGAIEAYSMAILKNGSVPHYFTNRYVDLKDYDSD